MKKVGREYFFKEKYLEVAQKFVLDYQIDNDNKEVLEKLFKYFSGIDTKELPITKGIFLKGSIGSGKTLIFKIVQKLIKGIAINNIRDIVAEFNIGGFDAIDEFVKTKQRVIDDIGQENNGKYYGNDTNVCQELIIRRYEKYQSNGILTHFTSNLATTDDLIEKYGQRAADRLSEMCSVVVLKTSNKSRRKKSVKPLIVDNLNEISKKNNDELNRKAIKSFIEKIYNGEELFNAMYVDVYNHLKKNNILILSEEKKKEITILAETQLIQERNHKIDMLQSKGKIMEAKNLNKKMFDIDSTVVAYQKKIAVIEFIDGCKEMDISVNDILIKK